MASMKWETFNSIQDQLEYMISVVVLGRQSLSILSKINPYLAGAVSIGTILFQFYPRSTLQRKPTFRLATYFFQFYPRSTRRLRQSPNSRDNFFFQFYPRSTAVLVPKAAPVIEPFNSIQDQHSPTGLRRR